MPCKSQVDANFEASLHADALNAPGATLEPPWSMERSCGGGAQAAKPARIFWAGRTVM